MSGPSLLAGLLFDHDDGRGLKFFHQVYFRIVYERGSWGSLNFIKEPACICWAHIVEIIAITLRFAQLEFVDRFAELKCTPFNHVVYDEILGEVVLIVLSKLGQDFLIVISAHLVVQIKIKYEACELLEFICCQKFTTCLRKHHVDLCNLTSSFCLILIDLLSQPAFEFVKHASQEQIEQKVESHKQVRNKEKHCEEVPMICREHNVRKICSCQQGQHAHIALSKSDKVRCPFERVSE